MILEFCHDTFLYSPMYTCRCWWTMMWSPQLVLSSRISPWNWLRSCANFTLSLPCNSNSCMLYLTPGIVPTMKCTSVHTSCFILPCSLYHHCRFQSKQEIAPPQHVVEKYIELLCRYEPEQVYTFLKSNDNYRLEEALDVSLPASIQPFS